jgi:hypothetical protein
MKVRVFPVVVVAAMALLVGPAAAWAKDEGAAQAAAEATSDQAEPVAGPAQGEGTAGSPESSGTDLSSDDGTVAPEASGGTDLPSSGTSETTAPSTAEPQVEASTAPDGAVADAGPQAESSAPVALQAEASSSVSVSHPRQTVKARKQGKYTNYRHCGAIATRAAAPAVPTGPGCSDVIPRGQISTDPANPTVFTINGVTFGVWTVDRPNGSELDWQIISGTFPGTDAINLTILQGLGPNSPTATCQISNAAPTGSCHLPARNNGKWWPLNHLVICSASTTVPPPPVTAPGGAGKPGGNAGTQGKNGGNAGGVAGRQGAGSEGSLAVSAAVAGGVPGAELPFTGLSVVSLLLVAACLLSGGVLMRTRLN